MFLLPPSLDEWVAPDHPVRFVRDLVDSLDFDELGFRASSDGDVGRPHYAPDLLLKVWLFGWMERTRSSRALERACMRDVAFLWLTGNQHPDHNTLWRFFRDNKPALRKLFKVVVQVAVRAELVGFALHAIDGTKVGAASSMETALHRKTLKEKLAKLDRIIDESIAATEAAERTEQATYSMPEALRDAKERKKQVQALLAELDASDTNHLHPKEPDARAMRSRQGNKLAYNAQAVVDESSDLIVGAGVSNDETDHGQLVSTLELVAEIAGANAAESVADAGYWSGSELAEAERRHLPVIVAEQAESSAGAYSKSKFEYDAERNAYVCPRGEVLEHEATNRPTTGKPYKVYVYRCRNESCPVRSDCTKSKDGRMIKRTEHEDALARNAAKQREPAKRALLARRKAIVEHIFAIAKAIDGFWRFSVRGLDGVRAQWALVCTAINVRKLYAFWIAGRIRIAAPM